MIGLKPYPEYKDSGVAWLGEVPGGIGSLKRGKCFLRMNHPKDRFKNK